MSITEDPTTVPPTSRGSMLLLAIVSVAAAGAILSAFFRQPVSGVPYGYPGESRVGLPMPDLEVEGWINVAGAAPSDLTGQIRVIDVWAYWCGPCRELSPGLKALHAKYAPRGVKFVGLTSMTSETLRESREFIEEEGLTWPQGYGAVAPLRTLEVNSIPAILVIDREGRIVWDMTSPEPIDVALDRLLTEAGG